MPPPTPPSKPKTHATPRQRRANGALGVALIVAALLHLPILLALPFLLRANQPPLSSELKSPRDFRLNLVADEAEIREKEKAEKKERLRDEREGQFISLDKPEVEQTPDEARFLDQFASKAARETVRKQSPSLTDKPANPAPPTPARPHPQSSPPTPKKAPPAPDMKPAEDGISRAETPDEFAPETPERPLSPGDLFPSAQNTPYAAADGSFDYLSDVDEGEKTLLNRKRSRYWSFMNRLKQGVAQEWSPLEEYNRRDPYGKVYGVKDRYTVLRVTLNGDGSLRTIHVAKSSGLKFYDDEAVRAMRAAAPFQNPPEGLKDRDGLIQINFGLLLDVSRGTVRGFRINRR